jgi:hypothetical protein
MMHPGREASPGTIQCESFDPLYLRLIMSQHYGPGRQARRRPPSTSPPAPRPAITTLGSAAALSDTSPSLGASCSTPPTRALQLVSSGRTTPTLPSGGLPARP